MKHRPVGLLADERQIPFTATILANGIAIVALLLSIFDLNLPGRAPLAVLSLLVVPGIPLAMAVPIHQPQVQLVLGIALSLACALLVSTVQLETGSLSPLRTQLVLLGIGLPGTVLAVGAARLR